MKKMSLVAAGSMAALWAINASAASYSYICNACTTAQTREMVQGSRTGDYFVHDMINRKVTHWAVGTGKDIDRLPITQVAITPAAQDQFNYVQALFDVARTLNIDLVFTMPPISKVTAISSIRDNTTYQPIGVMAPTGTDRHRQQNVGI
jgi:hypothetical protein